MFKVVILLILSSIASVTRANTVDDLIQQVKEMQLSSDAAWLDLLHYKKHVFSGVYSQADDDAFFLSSNGKFDANAELLSTLAAFYENKEKGHAQCLFPARLFWLNSKLHFAASLPQVECPKLKQWTQKLDAHEVTLLFPSMYLNNPGSMFGHTFLRFDSRNKAPLLNYTLSYAAEYHPDDNGLVYVFNGIAGGYPGVFNVQPYYETVQEYGDVEHRDIWEYSLDLNQQQVDQLIRHTWEVTGIKFDYYFLRENCSYRLLSLLDVAKPGLNMTQHGHPVYALPVDTVRSIKKAGLITDVLYRPARNSRIEKMLSQITTDAQQATFDLIEGNTKIDLDKFSDKQQAQIYELSHEISQLNDTDGQRFLLLRSQINLPTDKKIFKFIGARPEQSHNSAKWFIGYGVRQHNDFLELGLRPAFHDLLDAEYGFTKGASISVLDIRLRWYQHQQRLQLEKLTLFNMVSLSPIRQWANPLSWRLGFYIERRSLNSTDTKLLRVNGGAGYSIELGNIIFYMLVDAEIEYSKKPEDHYRFFMGAESGALLLFDNSRMKFTANSYESIAGHDGRKENYQWQYQFDINKKNALRLNAELKKRDDIREKEMLVEYVRYF